MPSLDKGCGEAALWPFNHNRCRLGCLQYVSALIRRACRHTPGAGSNGARGLFGAQGADGLEAEDVMTLGYSRDVLKAEEHINISKGRYIEERAAALPQFNLEGHVLHGRDASYSIFNLPPEKDDYQSNLSLNQVVFTWGQVNSAIRAAKHDKAASAYLLEEARQLALRETATVFFTLLLAEELADVARENLKQKARHLDETQRKFHAGVAMEYDVLAAQVAMANAGPEVTRAENDVRLVRDRLRYLLGIQEDFGI